MEQIRNSALIKIFKPVIKQAGVILTQNLEGIGGEVEGFVHVLQQSPWCTDDDVGTINPCCLFFE